MTLTASDIDRHMREVGGYVDWSKTCDTFKAGDPQTPIQRIAVSWMSSIANLREAHARGCNLFITHEPTFYAHMDNDPAVEQDACTREKRAFLRQTGMVVYRCHDVWDRFPEVGILDSWAAFLGLTAPPLVQEKFWRVVPIEPTPAVEFAREVSRRIRQFDQEAALLVGDPDRPVSRVGIGTGAITSAREYHRMGADVGIVTEITWWRDARWALDMDLRLIVVDHTVSEEPGVINLAGYLRRQFTDLQVEYIPTHCPFRIITARNEV
jgi:putative NIF3 family GTP cyclohydrolase 1 type 2